MRSSLALVPLAALLLGACTSVRSLGEAPKRLERSERTRVEAQVDRALAAAEWTVAWNQMVDLGAPRDRMEAIALQAIEADSGAAEAMLDALREKWGGLGPESLKRARGLAGTAEKDGDWERAVEIEILIAEDAPRYLRAWEVYERAPPTAAPDLLDVITKARDGAEEQAD